MDRERLDQQFDFIKEIDKESYSAADKIIRQRTPGK